MTVDIAFSMVGNASARRNAAQDFCDRSLLGHGVARTGAVIKSRPEGLPPSGRGAYQTLIRRFWQARRLRASHSRDQRSIEIDGISFLLLREEDG
jgi:hypothetical protein